MHLEVEGFGIAVVVCEFVDQQRREEAFGVR